MLPFLDLSECRRMRALLRLAEARQEAASAGHDGRRATVIVESLRPVRITDGDLTWLVNERLAHFTTKPTEAPRQKRLRRNKSTGRAALAITDAGLARVALCIPQIVHFVEPVLCWDAAPGSWTLDGELVKHLGENATAQRRILQACQDVGWTHEPINNPWRAMSASQRSRYLRVALARLNKSQKSGRKIHFTSMDDGRQFRWSFVLPKGCDDAVQ